MLSPGAVATGGCQEPNFHLLQEQQVFVTTEPSHHPQDCISDSPISNLEGTRLAWRYRKSGHQAFEL